MKNNKIEKGDFVEIDYVGMIKDEDKVFDTTKKKVADKNDLNPEADYKPITICIGEEHILPALEEQLEGKKTGEYKFELSPEEAFGKKSAKLLKLVPRKVFRQQDIQPFPGLEVNIDNNFGIVRSVSGGRVIVDFNHPLSGRDLVYEIEVKRFVEDKKEKLESYLNISQIPYDSASVKEKKATIVLPQELPDPMKEEFEKKVKELMDIEDINYVTKKGEEKKKEEKPNKEEEKKDKK